MAREFANTAGSPNIDYVTMSGVPPIGGLGTCSMVLRMAGDSDCVLYGEPFEITDGSPNHGIGIGRWNVPNTNSVYAFFKNGANQYMGFAFTFDGVMRSVIATFNGSATPKIAAYVDGSAMSITTGVAPTNTVISSSSTQCLIGGGTGIRWNGRIAEVAIYNRVITQGEALIHAAGYTTNHFPRGRIFCAPLIREVHDIVGGLTGTITGTTVSEHPRIYA